MGLSLEGNQERRLRRDKEAETKTGWGAGEEGGFQGRPAQTEVEKLPKPTWKFETETHPDAHQRRGVRSGQRRPAGGGGSSSLRGARGGGDYCSKSGRTAARPVGAPLSVSGAGTGVSRGAAPRKAAGVTLAGPRVHESQCLPSVALPLPHPPLRFFRAWTTISTTASSGAQGGPHRASDLSLIIFQERMNDNVWGLLERPRDFPGPYSQEGLDWPGPWAPHSDPTGGD